MEVILMEDVANLGELGDKVTVKSGYGRNYLIPQHKAAPATKENVKIFEERRAELERIAEEKLAEARTRAEKVNALDITLAVKAGDEGKLFGSVTVRDIAEAASARGVEIENSEIRLPEGPIRQIGEYEIDVQLHSEVISTLKLNVIAEQQV